MNLSKLLHQREALLRRTRLANLAYAYRRLGEFAGRISRARLQGKVCLRPADLATERYWPQLIALEGSQSVIEEHFTDEDVLELADLIAFVTGEKGADPTFRLEELEVRFMRPLRRQLRQAGVTIEQETPSIGQAKQRG